MRLFRLGTLFVVVLTGLVTFAQAQKPNTLVENDRVRVTRVDLSKGESLPDDNRYDAMTVRLKDGETALTESGQTEKMDSGPMQQSHYFVARSRRAVKNVGKETLPFVEVLFLRTPGKYVALDIPPSHYCNPESQKACVTERYLFCTDRFCAETVTMDPGAISTQHTHASDYMVIATSDFTWRNEPAGKPAADESFKTGDVKYIEAGGTHRLVNASGTTARLIMVQFK